LSKKRFWLDEGLIGVVGVSSSSSVVVVVVVAAVQILLTHVFIVAQVDLSSSCWESKVAAVVVVAIAHILVSHDDREPHAVPLLPLLFLLLLLLVLLQSS